MGLFGILRTFLSQTEPKAEGLRDIRGPAEIALPVKEILIILGVVAFLLLLTWLLFRFLKKRKERPPVPERVLTPEELVMKRLYDPALSAALEKGDFKFYYFGISDAVREYVAGRFDIDAMDLTTHELLFRFQKKSESAPVFSQVEAFLNRCDLVKFAKFRPSYEEAKKSLSDALGIVTLSEDFFSGKARKEQELSGEALKA
ncbi:MAG: hypothetical protein ACE5FU_00710 [Nitrospinota bacterium]